MRQVKEVQGELQFGTQCDMILEALQRGETITPLEALKRFGCFRLGARIYDLKRRGHRIWKLRLGSCGKRFAGYTMRDPYTPTPLDYERAAGGETRGDR